jgi:DNA-directed RNA polymerase specialized sigma24 family protein
VHTAPELLARRAARGDGDAFELLCRRLQDDVWRYCRALSGDHEVALEAAQETFLRLVSAILRFRGDGPVRVFVLVIARRQSPRRCGESCARGATSR